MSESYVRNVLEAALLAAGNPVTPAELLRLFEEGVRPSPEELRGALEQLAAGYEGRGIELKETASGYRIQVRRELSAEISRLFPERAARYSRALLETLALIAYRQPITRAEIEAVRGVAVNPNIIRTVIERNWVRVVGHRDVPGHPELLGTTREFLDYFGLKYLDDLPPLAELQAMGEDVNLQLTCPWMTVAWRRPCRPLPAVMPGTWTRAARMRASRRSRAIRTSWSQARKTWIPDGARPCASAQRPGARPSLPRGGWSRSARPVSPSGCRRYLPAPALPRGARPRTGSARGASRSTPSPPPSA